MEKSSLDLKGFFAIVFAGISARLSYVGDTVSFVRPPTGFFEHIASLLHTAAFNLTESRLYSGLAVFLFYGFILVVIFGILAKWYEKKVLWPRKLKKMMGELAMHRDLANQYNRGKRGDLII